jgi:DNA-binding CsgD family transcriptional regulator
MNHYLFENLLQVKDEDELRQSVQHITETLGFDSFCYGIAYHPLSDTENPGYFYLGNYPEEWMDLFFEKDYVSIDPTVTHCYTNTTPLIWTHRLFETPEQQEIHHLASSFGINGGATLPIHSNWLNGMGCLAVGTSDDADKAAHHVAERLAASQLLACYVSQAVRDLTLLPGEFRFAQREELTPREAECLRWAIQGLQAKDIAKKMKISVPTVTTHYLPAIRRKLGVSSTREAVSVAVFHRLVQF